MKYYYFKIVMYYLKTIDSLSVLYCLILEFLFLEQIVFKDQFYCWIWQAWHEANIMSLKEEFAEYAG